MGSKDRLAGLARLRDHLTYANVMATLAVFIALGSTATAAVIITSNSQVAQDTISGHNPPTGKHSNIISGSVNGADLSNGAVGTNKLANGAVNGSKVLDGSLGGSDIGNGSLGGAKIGDGSLSSADIQDNGLTGADINEGTLAEVPSAKVGGFGRDRYGGSCYPNGAAYVDCVVLTVNLPTHSKVLLLGATEAAPQNGDAAGSCKLVTQFGDIPYTVVDYSLHGGDAVSGSLVGITGALGPGPVDFGIDCNQSGGTMEYFAHLVAMQIAPD
jgi:hypothetical protein